MGGTRSVNLRRGDTLWRNCLVRIMVSCGSDRSRLGTAVRDFSRQALPSPGYRGRMIAVHSPSTYGTPLSISKERTAIRLDGPTRRVSLFAVAYQVTTTRVDGIAVQIGEDKEGRQLTAAVPKGKIFGMRDYSPALGGYHHPLFRRCEGGILKAIRYLATVRRAILMPLAVNASYIS